MKRILFVVGLLLPFLASAEYVGDFYQGDTINHLYNTYKSSDGSDLQRTAAGTLACHQDGATTDITAGVSDSGTTAFNSNTGSNKITIVATSANGFTAGHDYDCGWRAATLNAVTVSAISIVSFSIENRVGTRGVVPLHGTENTGQVSTVNQIYLTGNPITSDGQYQFNRLWDVTDNWQRAIINSNAASDYLNIYPDAPAAPTDGAVMFIVRDIIYPVNNFDPTVTPVIVKGFGPTVGTATTCSANCGANIEAVFDNSGAPVGPSVTIGAIAANALAGSLDRIIETGGGGPPTTFTAKCALAVIMSGMAGTYAIVGNTVTFKDPTGTNTRIVGTLVTNGRSANTITCPP